MGDKRTDKKPDDLHVRGKGQEKRMIYMEEGTVRDGEKKAVEHGI